MKNIIAILIIGLSVLIRCTTPTVPADPIPEHQTLKIHSAILDEERVINVWVPQQYQIGTDYFAVLYMADGGVNEDFPHIANTLEKLIFENKIKPMILVGIENTQRMRDLTGPTNVESDKKRTADVGGSSNFRKFIKEELFSEIDKQYRTTNEKTIIGESASGLFVMETFLLEPDMFDNYIAFDPSLWWNDHELVKKSNELLDKFPTTPKRLWYAGSQAKDINPHTKALEKILSAKDMNNLTWTYSDEPKEKHNTIFRATKEKALIWMFN